MTLSRQSCKSKRHKNRRQMLTCQITDSKGTDIRVMLYLEGPFADNQTVVRYFTNESIPSPMHDNLKQLGLLDIVRWFLIYGPCRTVLLLGETGHRNQ